MLRLERYGGVTAQEGRFITLENVQHAAMEADATNRECWTMCPLDDWFGAT